MGGIAYIVAAALGMAAGAYLCGASSAVLAIMSVVAIAMPDYELNLFIFGRVKLKWFALVCILLTLLGSGGSQAGTVAHIGGVLCGVAYGMIRKMDNAQKPVTLKNVYRKVRKKNVQAVVPHMHCFEHALGHSCFPCSLITNKVVSSLVTHSLSPHPIHTDPLDGLPSCTHIPTSENLSLQLPCMDISFTTFTSLLKQGLAILGVFHDSHIRQSLSFLFTLSLHSSLCS